LAGSIARRREAEGDAKMTGPRTRWSLKEDRRLLELSKQSLTIEAIADRLKRTPDSILKMAIRLGLSLKSDRRLKAKGK
jgi:hypothetical protein